MNAGPLPAGVSSDFWLVVVRNRWSSVLVACAAVRARLVARHVIAQSDRISRHLLRDIGAPQWWSDEVEHRFDSDCQRLQQLRLQAGRREFF